MMNVCTYIDRHYLGDFKAIDYTKKFNYLSCWNVGGLTYFKLDRFNTKVIETSMILSL